MDELRVAVVGAGRLGSLHARKYAGLEHVRLTHVVDIDSPRASEIAAFHGAAPLSDYRELAGKVAAAFGFSLLAMTVLAASSIAAGLLAIGSGPPIFRASW